MIDTLAVDLVYLVAVFALFFLGKKLYDWRHPTFVLRHELFERDVAALAVALVGYYFGLVLALGGVLVGPSRGLAQDAIDLAVYGALALVLLHLADFVSARIIFRTIDLDAEIVRDGNLGVGALEAGSHIANGLVIAGVMTGGGGPETAVTFWVLGQVALFGLTRLYIASRRFDVVQQLRHDNVAVGVAVGGLLVAVGNIIRHSVEGDFVGWQESLVDFGTYLVIAALLLPLIRWLCDRVLVPGVRLDDELLQADRPNVGAGLIEAFSYVAASMLVGWAVL
ncbi:MAG: DUF350 domain-containing protein [Acidobacteriota bacterium]